MNRWGPVVPSDRSGCIECERASYTWAQARYEPEHGPLWSRAVILPAAQLHGREGARERHEPSARYRSRVDIRYTSC